MEKIVNQHVLRYAWHMWGLLYCLNLDCLLSETVISFAALLYIFLLYGYLCGCKDGSIFDTLDSLSGMGLFFYGGILC